jgi:hypothetical protein
VYPGDAADEGAETCSSLAAFCRVMCRNPRSSPDERRSWNWALLWVSGACVLGFLHENQRRAGYSAAFCKGAARCICTRAKTLDGDPRQRPKLAEYDRRKPDSGRVTPRGLFAEMGARVPPWPRLALVIAAPPLTGCAKILRASMVSKLWRIIPFFRTRRRAPRFRAGRPQSIDCSWSWTARVGLVARNSPSYWQGTPARGKVIASRLFFARCRALGGE